MSATVKEPSTTAPVNGNGNGYKVIGTRPIRPDGTDKVTGHALYGADIRLPGMLYGAVLRSPHAHARILSIDTSEAEALAGVKAVVTVADFGEIHPRSKYATNNVLAGDKVLYHYHAIAGVAAVSRHVAEEATKLIKVEYEVLSPVLDVREAMRDDSTILHDEMRTDAMGAKGDTPSNVASHLQHKRGDLEKGFAEADVIVERGFCASPVHQGYIEPQNGTAVWRRDGELHVWTSTQGAFDVRQQMSRLMGVPISKVKVTPMEIGGGFGGKIDVYVEPVAALLSKKSGHHPVKIVMSRAAVLAATGPNSGSYIRVKMGATKAGKITAVETSLAYESGAFPGSPVGSGAGTILGPYNLENFQIDGYDVLVNKPKASAYRAPGTTNAAFASETVIDEVAEKLGMDPIDFRLINGAKEGDRQPAGPKHGKIGYLETLQAVKDSEHYNAPLAGEGPNRGRGVATGVWFNWGGQSSVTASINPDGSITLIEGSTDIGGTRASIAMQMAETLGMAMEDITARVADTDSVGYNDVTGGSRTTYSSGMAAHEVAKKFIAELTTHAADLWDVSEEDVQFNDGTFSSGEESLSFHALAKQVSKMGVSISASASVHPQKYGPGFGAHIVDLQLDPETGKVTILRFTALQDVGTAIHPSYVEGQMQGGVVQGIGWALNEEYVYDDEGRLRNASLLDYRMPTTLDLPMIETILVEVPCPNHPYGVRGVGEVPIVPPPAAVANALYRATDIRLLDLPMSPVRVTEALWAQNGH